MATPELLRKLLTVPGPSGYEAAAAAVWRDAASAFAEVSVDTMGTSYARVRGDGDGPLLALVGHIDEIGLIVSHIDDDGFLRFGQVGGWDPVNLVGQRVTLATRDGDVDGVIGKKPIHLMKPDDRKNVPELKQLHIDIGARDGDEARSRVRIGDVAVIAGEPLELPNGRIVSRSMDNRLGCYVALEAARLVAEAGGAAGDVVAVAAVQEETTLAGATTSAFSLQPDVAIAIDVGFATDQPGIELGEMTKHPFGSGPTVARGTPIHPAVFELLAGTADAEGIPYTIESVGRGSGTDADALHVSRGGIPSGLISIPLRYMHSPVEMVQLDDVEASARLVAAFALALTQHTPFTR